MVLVNRVASPSRNLVYAFRARAERCAPLSFLRRAVRLFSPLLAGLFAATAIVGLPPLASAQSPKPSQYDVQAVYLYDFAKFVRWPAGGAAATLDICVAAQSTYADTLTKIVAGEQIGGRPLAVRAVERPEQEAGCAVLFIGSAMKDSFDALLSAATGKPMLTVSDLPGFLDRGGMIQFVVVNNRVRFAVDLHPVDRSGIALSAELLKVAVAVNGKSTGGGAP